jgi:NAD(P)-dependent dehydrogenase (short-subunit alcohol dehydrogenase family)
MTKGVEMPQRVLITAAASGIGREMVRAFAKTGAKIFICDIDEPALEALRAKIPGLGTTVCDMASRAQIEKMVPQAVHALGGLDVLVNNAGIAGPTAPVDAIAPEEWDRTMAVNITGMFDVTRLAIPALKQSQAGVIINMSSIAGRSGFANRSPYAASKWAVVGFTKTLALELGGNGIRANAILPGAVAGERIERVFAGRARIANMSLDDARAESMASQSIKAMVDPKDIAQLAVYLASDAAKAISGQAIPIDNDRQRA